MERNNKNLLINAHKNLVKKFNNSPKLQHKNYLEKAITIVKGISSREAARGHATYVDGIVLSVTINRIYNY